MRPRGRTEFGTKTEIKNLNSFRAVEKALHYEITRQSETLASGGRIGQETRLWDADREVTRPMRSKEFAHDYRYFPDPDLLPLSVEDDWVQAVKATLPELPAERLTVPRRRRTFAVTAVSRRFSLVRTSGLPAKE